MMPSVMIVTDNDEWRTSLLDLLAPTDNDPLEVALNIRPSELLALTPTPEVIVIGYEAEYYSDFVPLQKFKQALPAVPIIAIADSNEVDFAVQVMQTGATNYIPLAELNAETLLAAIEEARSSQRETQAEIEQSFLRLLLSGPGSSPTTERGTGQTEAVVFASTIQIDDLVIDHQRLTVRFRDKRLDLSPTEFEILSHLAQFAGQVVSFEALVFHVYDIQTDRDQARRTLAAHISNLRKKLRAVGCTDYLVNRRGRGYLIDRQAITTSLSDTQHYAIALQAGNSGIWEVDLSTGQVQIIPESGTFFGQHEETDSVLYLRDVFDYIPQPHRQRVTRTIVESLQGSENTFEFEYPIDLRDGINRDILSRAMILRDDNGIPQRITGLSIDITDQKLKTQFADHYMQALHSLTAQVPDLAICLYNHNLNVIISAGQILDQLRPGSQTKGSELAALFFAVGRPDFEHQLQAVFAKEITKFEYEHQNQTFVIDLLPIIDKNSDVVMGMIVVQNVTTLRQLDTLVDGEMERLTTEIITQVTGETRATLASLQTTTEMLIRYRDRIPEEEQKERLNQIQTAINQLLGQFESIAALGQTLSGRQD